jgi:hypothetical protein
MAAGDPMVGRPPQLSDTGSSTLGDRAIVAVGRS